MGFLSKLFNGKSEKTTIRKDSSMSPEDSRIEFQQPDKKKPDVVIPSQKDGAPLAYKYSVSFLLTNKDALIANIAKEDWFLTPKEMAGSIHLFSSDVDIGVLLQREDMLRDWIKRNDPYIICVEKISSDSDMCTAFIAFYKDKRKGNDWREQSVVALTAFKAEYKQDTIMCLTEGEELEAEEDFDDHVIISTAGCEIGRLPAKYAKRYMDDGAYAIFFEKSEETEDFAEKPFVRIYWYDRA